MKPGQSTCSCGKVFFPRQAWMHEKCGNGDVVEQVAAPAANAAAVGQASSVKHVTNSVKHRMRVLGSQGGRVGGRVRAERLSPERRVEIARAGAAARWGRA